MLRQVTLAGCVGAYFRGLRACSSVGNAHRKLAVKLCQETLEDVQNRGIHLPKQFGRFCESWTRFISQNVSATDSEATQLENEIAIQSLVHAMVKSANLPVCIPLIHKLSEAAGMAMSQDDMSHILVAMSSPEFDKIEEVLGIMMRDLNFRPNIKSLNFMLTEMLKYSKASEAITVFRKLAGEFNLAPDVVTMNLLLQMLADADMHHECKLWYDKFTTEYGLFPDAITIQAYLYSCAKARDLEAAFDMLKLLKSVDEVLLSSRTLGALVRGAIAAGDLQGMERWMSIGIEDLRIIPNVITVNIIIDAYAKIQDWNMASKWFTAMIDNWHLQPSQRSMGALLNACIRAGQLKEAEIWWRKFIVQWQFDPNIAMFDTMLAGYQHHGTTDEFTAWLGNLSYYDFEPSRRTIAMALITYAKAGDVVRVETWMKIMEQHTRRVVPERRAVWAAIDCFLKHGKFELAQDWLSRVSVYGFEPDVVIYTSLIDCFARKGKKQEMLKQFNSLLAADISPNRVTVNVMLKGFARSRPPASYAEIEEFIKFVCSKFGIHLDSFSYFQLLSYCVRSKQPQIAMKIFDELLLASVEPSPLLLNQLLLALGQAKFKEYSSGRSNLVGVSDSIVTQAVDAKNAYRRNKGRVAGNDANRTK